MSVKEKIFKFSKSPIGDLVVGVVFSKLSTLLPVERVKENERVIAFWHPKPFWEKHIVIVPKKAIKSLAEMKEEDASYINDVFLLAKEIVEEQKWAGYSIMMNGGSRQEVGQIHFHLYTGKKIGE